ncbi:hypothetical protein KBY22_11525 [Ruegeria pomeroyi]|nr:hypothetical protein [Ruegeria pomeroyi]
MSWLSRHAASIEALAAMATAALALAALIGVKLQLDEADRLQRQQSAREAFRAHLALAATLPDFAAPADECRLLHSDRGGAYSAFVDHLLYSAEQMLSVSEGWETSFLDLFEPHRTYLCSDESQGGETEETAALLARFRASTCAEIPACD